MNSIKKPVGEVVDLFCGVGGLSHGFLQSGFSIKAGYDTDEKCRYAYEKNNGAKFFTRDVSKLTANEVAKNFSGKLPTVLAGCAPCQPFSTYKQRYDEDPRWNLVGQFAELATQIMPDYVTMENVPALVKYKDGKIFANFINTLESAGYKVSWTIAKCEEFGVPQKRRRLVVIAAKSGKIVKLVPQNSAFITVKEAIGNLPKIAAGGTHPSDRLHSASSLSKLNLKRIRASKQGGTWRDWPFYLRAECHKRPTGHTYPSVYARMSWDDVSPTMTTQCYGYGNGRFGHPEQDRAISLREAAILQTFPVEYEFIPPEETLSINEVGRWIGNAVPVKLAFAIGSVISENHKGASLVR